MIASVSHLYVPDMMSPGSKTPELSFNCNCGLQKGSWKHVREDSRSSVTVGGEQSSVRDHPQVALLPEQLVPEKRRAVPVPSVVWRPGPPVPGLPVPPHVPLATQVDAGGRLEAGACAATRGRGLVIRWRREGGARLGAGDYFIGVVAVVACSRGRNCQKISG